MFFIAALYVYQNMMKICLNYFCLNNVVYVEVSKFSISILLKKIEIYFVLVVQLNITYH